MAWISQPNSLAFLNELSPKDRERQRGIRYVSPIIQQDYATWSRMKAAD